MVKKYEHIYGFKAEIEVGINKLDALSEKYGFGISHGKLNGKKE